MENFGVFSCRVTTIRAIFSKSGYSFWFSKKGKGAPPPPSFPPVLSQKINEEEKGIDETLASKAKFPWIQFLVTSWVTSRGKGFGHCYSTRCKLSFYSYVFWSLLYVLFWKFVACSFPISDWLKIFVLLYFEKKSHMINQISGPLSNF